MGYLNNYNIFKEKGATFKALTDPGFEIHPKIIGVGSNVKQDKIFDQIAFISPDLKDKLADCNAGVFNFYEHVYRDEDQEIFKGDITGNTKYGQWRTYQMSDHFPMWIELRVDFSTEYLKAIEDEKNAVIPISAPVIK